ncbi:hypothetical protein Tco_1426633, partial [Tanacetum coccineum]
SPRQTLQEDTQFPQTSVHIPNVADDAIFKEWDDRVLIDPGAKKPWGVSLLRLSLRGHLNIPMIHISQEGSCLGTIKDSSRFGDQKAEKEGQKMEKKLRARTTVMKLFKIGTSRRKSLDKANVSKQGRKSDKTKPMFDDSNFVELDVDNAMENVEGDAETQGRNTAKQITTNGDTVNTASIDVSVVGPSNGSTADPSTSTAGDIFEDEMMTIADTLVAIRSTRPTTTSVVICDVEEEPRRATPIPTVQSQDKGKGKMVEPEPTPKNPLKAQIQRDAKMLKDCLMKNKHSLKESKGLLGNELQNKKTRMQH